MKTTEMIVKVRDAQNYLILNERGRAVKTDTMRDLGFVLYTIIEQVKEGHAWSLIDATNVNLGCLPIIVLYAFKEGDDQLIPDTVVLDNVEYWVHNVEPLEFDSFGELENWSKVTEEEATLLLTKAPTEPVKDEPGIDLFKQVFDLIGLKYEEYDISDVNDEYAQFMHRTEDRYVDIMFDKGLVQIGHAGNSEPPRKLKITLEPIETNEPSTVPDERT